MFTVVRTTTNLSLDEHFIKHPAGTFFVKVEGDGMVEHGMQAVFLWGPYTYKISVAPFCVKVNDSIPWLVF